MKAETRPGPGQDSRQALVRAAMRAFGEKGFSATSTREIARAAGVNISLIAYHFGGKEGLRTACAQAMVDRISSILTPAAPLPEGVSPETASRMMSAMVAAMVRFIAGSDEARDMASFILRELAAPGPAFDTVYERLFRPMHERACALFALATGGDPESETVKLAVFSMIGQIVYFRLAAPFVLRRTGWSAFGETELAMVSRSLERNLSARIELERTGKPSGDTKEEKAG